MGPPLSDASTISVRSGSAERHVDNRADAVVQQRTCRAERGVVAGRGADYSCTAAAAVACTHVGGDRSAGAETLHA